MTNSNRILVALLTLLFVATGVASAQKQPFAVTVRLPGENNVREVGQEFASGDLVGAIAAALNSEGDTITLALEMEASVGAFANVGVQGSREVTLERTEDGYELEMAMDTSLTFGAEAIDDIEINFPVGVELAVVMEFARLQDIGRALRAAALSTIGLPALLMEQMRLDDLLRGAVNAVPSLQDTVNVLTEQRRKLHAQVVGLKKKLGSARKTWQRALRKAEKKARRVRRIPFVGKKLKRLVKKLFKIARKTDRVWKGIDRTLTATLAELDKVARNLESIAADLARKLDIIEIAKAGMLEVLDFIAWCGAEVQWLGERFRAFAGRFHVGVEGEVSVAIENAVPGLSLANSGVGASAGLEMFVGLRYDLPEGSTPGALTVSYGRGYSLGLQAVVVVGAQAEANATVTVSERYVRQGGAWRLDASETEYAADLGLWAVAGIGISAEYGAGMDLSLTFDNQQVSGQVEDAVRALFVGDVQRAVTALGGIQATFEAQGWRHAAFVLGGGYSAAGNGLTLEASATWRDADAASSQTASAAAALMSISRETERTLNAVAQRF